MIIEMYEATVAHDGKSVGGNLSFQADSGNIVGITGGNADSRTAIIESMLGFRPLTKGWVSIDGEPLLPGTAAYFRNKTGYMPRTSGLTDENVGNFFKYVVSLSSNAGCIYSKEAVIKEWEALSVGAECYDKQFAELPAAVAQRICLSLLGLLARPIAILDSPTSAQDADGRIAVLSYLCSPRFKQIATIAATDDPAMLSICNKTININQGDASMMP